MQIIVNGVNLSPYVSASGLHGQISGVNGPQAGRTMDTIMHTFRLGTKRSLQITCRPLTEQELKIVLDAIEPEYLTVTFRDAQAGANITKEMYTNNVEYAFLRTRRDGTDTYTCSFPLIER